MWSDEFSGSNLDGSKWFHETEGPNGGIWYNNEKQHYTDSTDNSFVNGGYLNIVARAETTTPAGAPSRDFTSARLNSRYLFGPGRIEVRARMPSSSYGTWPAIWMLGTNTATTLSDIGTDDWPDDCCIHWPLTGEIDIMEQYWGATDEFKSAVHYSGGVPFSSPPVEADNIAQNFHTYGVVWNREEIEFEFDGVSTYTVTKTMIETAGGTWPFADNSLYLLLNVAVGGNLAEPNSPEPASFPEDPSQTAMQVDWVRYYA